MARWQFQDFCKENLRNNEEFRRTVERMITAEEKTRERFPDRNNQNTPDKQNHRNIRHQERKHGQDNTVAVADKPRKFSKSKRYDDIENMHCILHPNGTHTIGNCYTSTNDTQGKIVRRTLKKIVRKKKKTTTKTKDSKNPGGQ